MPRKLESGRRALDVKAITVKKRATDRATGCLEQGMKMIGY